MDRDFDEFLHVSARLSVVALLSPADWVEFAFVRDAVGTSDSALSKQVAALADAGYVEIRKTRNPTGRHTHLRLTSYGRQAFRRHASALERIVAAARRPQE
ncbi:transcriptional regulator [Streptomyces sp. NPDC012765]|uniref:transcriptional regulator n=1 Tax=Streptomyces sp. NPDC012765 TaxID=3155249 RepID=UPI0033E647D1